MGAVGSSPGAAALQRSERWRAGAAGAASIRDVIAFPKTTAAQCLLMEAPAQVADAQLAELHVARAGKALEPPPPPTKPHAHAH